MKLFLAVAAMIMLSFSAWGEVEGGCQGGTVCPQEALCRSDIQAYLVPSGTASPGSQNRLWMLDPWGKRGQDLSLPAGKKAILVIVPSSGGYLNLFHRHPTGGLQSQYLGHVVAGQEYQMWISSAEVGTHEIWYRTRWQESNTARIHVWG